MSNFDWSDLDVRLLKLLVAVVETGSITAAAARLDVTQSAVSHLLNKLRAITGDALFVKSGRGIVATAQAEALAAQARELLTTLEQFARPAIFDPRTWRTRITIAANDFQREVLLPGLLARLRAQAPGVQLRVIPSDVPTLAMLREQHCQLIISPRPPDGTDVVQKRLFTDRYRVFYDAAVRKPPRTRGEYLSAQHVTVVYTPQRLLDLDQYFAGQGIHRQFAVMVPGFAGLPAFIRNSNLIATAPGLLAHNLLRELASVPLPITCPPLPMYMIWHLRHHADAAHIWLRSQIEQIAKPLASRS